MKKLNIIPLILLITVLFFQSCDNEDEYQDPFPNTWKLDKSEMELVGKDSAIVQFYDFDQGNINKNDSIYFSKDGRIRYENFQNHIYEFKADGSLLFSSENCESTGTYSVSKNSVNIELATADECGYCFCDSELEITYYDNSSLILESIEYVAISKVGEISEIEVKHTHYFSR